MDVRLSQLKPQQKGIIQKVTAPAILRRRLFDMGLTGGTEIHVVRAAPMGDPIEYLVRGYGLSLRKQEADMIQVSLDVEE